MFKEGDIVSYLDITGEVVFACDISISILIGDEKPRARQIRVVVYNYDWDKVNKICDNSKNVTPIRNQLLNCPLNPHNTSKSCIVVTSSKTTN